MLWRTIQENGIQREQEDIDSLSEWVEAVRFLILKFMEVLNWSLSVNATLVFKKTPM